jgi:hypothetical protein
MVKRYSLGIETSAFYADEPVATEDPEGKYVLHSQYLALEAEASAYADGLKELVKNAEADLKAEWGNLNAATDRIKELESGLRTIGGWALAAGIRNDYPTDIREIHRKVKSLLPADFASNPRDVDLTKGD